MTPSRRGRRALAIALLLASVAIALPRFLTHTPYQRLGVTLDGVPGERLPKVETVFAPPAKGLLQPGDELVAIDGVSLTDSILRSDLRRKGMPRGTFELTVRRGGELRRLTIPPLDIGAWQRLRLFIFPVIAVIAAPLVALLLVWRRPDLGTAWTFLWFACMQGMGVIWGLFQYPQIEPTRAFRLYLKMYEWLVLWYPASFLHFMTTFPRPRWRGAGRWRSPWFWLVVAAYLAPVVVLLSSAVTGTPTLVIYPWLQTVAIPLGVASLVERYARPGRGDWHPRVSERVLALIVGVSLLLATAVAAISEAPDFYALMPMPLVRLMLTAVTAAWLSSPLIVAFLIANDPAFDPRRIIVRSLPYALLSGVLAAVYLAVVLISQQLFAAATGEEAMVFNVIAALVVAFAFAPLRERLQRGLDRIYGRDPQALRNALDGAGRELLGALDRDEVRASVESGIARGLKRPVEVEWPAAGAPRLAEREELDEDVRVSVEGLLRQAGIRLENLALHELRVASERDAAELREAATRAELRALHAQVQPHFLFNALNTLAYLIETDPAAAQRFTERLADMLRYTVEAGERPAALLSEEIGFVEDYLGVARERYENPLHFEYRGARELLSAAVPPLLLQPLVENSLKHGCAPDQEALHLSLDARLRAGWLDLEFSDDGESGGNGTPGLGVGLQNLSRRVRRFGGRDACVEAGPRAGGGYAVRVRWRVPAKEGG